MKDWTEEQEKVVAEFRRCVWRWFQAVNNPDNDSADRMGALYALDMAEAEVGLLGLNPRRFTSNGYEG